MVNCILDAYEGMCFAHTLDRKVALVEVMVMPGWEEQFEVVLDSLAEQTDLVILEKEKPFRG